MALGFEISYKVLQILKPSNLLLSTNALEVLECTVGWKDCSAELQEVVSSGVFGKHLFENCLSHVVSGQLEELIKERLDVLFGQDLELTVAMVTEAKVDILKASQKLHGLEMMAPKRKVTIMYRGEKLEEVSVASVSEHVEMAVAARLKELAVQLLMLPKLACEDNGEG